MSAYYATIHCKGEGGGEEKERSNRPGLVDLNGCDDTVDTLPLPFGLLPDLPSPQSRSSNACPSSIPSPRLALYDAASGAVDKRRT